MAFHDRNEDIAFKSVDEVLLWRFLGIIDLIGLQFETNISPIVHWIDETYCERALLLPICWNSIFDLEQACTINLFAHVVARWRVIAPASNLTSAVESTLGWSDS